MKTVKTIKNFFRKAWGTLCLIPVLALTAQAEETTAPTGGGDFANSTFALGTQRLLDDVSAWLIGIGFSVSLIAVIVYIIFRATADEADGKMWMKRIKIAGICGVAVGLAGSFIALISSYYTT